MPTNRLGELLMEAGLVTAEVLDSALQQTRETGLPMGRVLILTGLLPEAIIHACLNTQILLRDGKITREQAITGLRAAYQRQMTIEQALMEQGFYRPQSKAKVKLGELFVLAGLLNEQDIMNALEIGLLNNEPIGQVLVRAGLITRELLDTALKMQEMVDNNTLAPISAAEVLRQVDERKISIARAVAELGLLQAPSREKIKLGELLKLAGMITDVDIQYALQLSVKNNTLLGKMLLVSGVLEENTLHAALRAQFLLREDFLKEEQAIIALHYCQRMQCTMDNALEELGWTVPTRTGKKSSEAIGAGVQPQADQGDGQQ
jgi:hypothetical protein